MTRYEEEYLASINDVDGYWSREAEKLFWYEPFRKVLDAASPPFYKWFVGGKTNICYNAVDRHASGPKKDKTAIIWESPETGGSCTYTFAELLREVNRCASVLKDLGVCKGDRVIIYMPMVPEAVFAMLSCVRIGAIHSVVFAGFSYEALAERIDDARPRIIMTADGGMRKGKGVQLKPIVDKALERSKWKTEHVIVLDRGIARCDMVPGRDLDWVGLMKGAGDKTVPCDPLESSAPSYILYTSGTTGKPKGVVRDTGGHMVALHTSMEKIYDVGDDDIYWSTSDIGWVVGHSYIVYGPLLKGVPTIIYEGTPDHPSPDIWWRVVEKHKVTVMFSAPTALRMLRKYPAEWLKKHDIHSLRYIFLAGEPLDEPTWRWATETFDKPVIDHYWQTETGWAILANMAGLGILPIKPGSPTKPVVGYEIEVVDEKGEPVSPDQKGHLVIKPPLPPGNFMTIWGDDSRFVEYWRQFPGKFLYNSGDYAIVDKDGYFFMLGRSDEVINIAGHRLGTREVEEAISSHAHVAETSAIGVKDELKGEAIVAFVVLKHEFTPSPDEERGIKGLVRETIGPIAVPREVHFVRALPKTRSGKVMRRVLKALVEGRGLGDLSTLEDGASVEEIRQAVEQMGI